MKIYVCVFRSKDGQLFSIIDTDISEFKPDEAGYPIAIKEILTFTEGEGLELLEGVK